MSKLFKLFRSKKADKENILDEDLRDLRSSRHVKFGKKNQGVRNTYKNGAHSDYDEEDEDNSSAINLRQSAVLNPYNVVTEPKKAKSAKSWAGALDNDDRSRHGGGRIRSSRYNRSPGASNDMHNRSFASEFLTTTMEQDLRNSKHHLKSKRHALLPQPQQQWRRGQPLRERFDDNNVDSNSSTQYSTFSEYANNISRRSNRGIGPNYLQMSFTNELRLENKIMKLESKCINYKERLIHATKTCKSLQKEKYELECEFEELKKILLNLTFENQKLKSTIEKQNEMLSNYKNNFDLNFIKNDGNHRSSFYNKNQKQQQNVDNFAMFTQKYGYMGPPNTFPHNELLSMSANRASIIDNQQYCSNKKMQINEKNSITTSTACVRGSGESLANLSVSSTNVFSNISNSSGAILRSNQQLTPKNNQIARNDFNDILNAGTSTTHDQLNQFHQQINVQRQQHRMHKKNDNFSNDGFAYQKNQHENDLAKQSTFNSIFSKNDLVLSNQNNGGVIYSNAFAKEEQPTSVFLLSMADSNGTKNFNKQNDFLNNDFNNHLQKSGLQSSTGPELCSPMNFNVFMMDINKNSEGSADTHSNDAESGYSALLTTPIDDEADEVKNFRSKHADSSRQDTDLEDLELIKQNLIQESLNSSSRGSIQPGIDAFSSPEIARGTYDISQNISSTAATSLLLDSTLTEENSLINNVEKINANEVHLSTVSLNSPSKTNSSGEFLIQTSNSSSENSYVVPINLYSTISKNKLKKCISDDNEFDIDENKENLDIRLSHN